MKTNQASTTISTSDAILFKTLASNLPYLLFTTDTIDFNIQYINKLQPGFILEEVIGKSVFDFVLPNQVDFFRKTIEEVVKSKETSSFEIHGNSGDRIDGTAWYRTQVSIIKSSESSEESIMFLSRDITEEKLTEINNQDRSERIKAIINNTDDIICSIDKAYKLTEFNSVFSALVKRGYAVELAVGMHILDFIDPTKHEKLYSIYNRVEHGETCYDIEKFDTVSGKVMYNESSYHPIFSADGEISGISIFSKDITERINNEQRIQNTLREKEILLIEIHHRIKNNLALVSSLLQFQELNTSNVEAQEVLALSRKRIKSTALIHELLYKSESFDRIDLREYLVELFEHLRYNNSINLKYLGDEAKLSLSIAMPLGLMLNELILNSFKHAYNETSKGSTTVEVKLADDMLQIEYTDFVGEFPKTIDFNQPISLGLTLIHTFAEQLDGSIELLNRTPPQYKILVPLSSDV